MLKEENVKGQLREAIQFFGLCLLRISIFCFINLEYLIVSLVVDFYSHTVDNRESMRQRRTLEKSYEDLFNEGFLIEEQALNIIKERKFLEKEN